MCVKNKYNMFACMCVLYSRVPQEGVLKRSCKCSKWSVQHKCVRREGICAGKVQIITSVA